MSNLISREEAIKAIISESLKDGAYGYLDAYSIVDLLKNLPTKEPERKKGVQLEDEDDPESVKTDGYCAYCSACKEWSEYLTAYCGSCGADMRGTWNETN